MNDHPNGTVNSQRSGSARLEWRDFCAVASSPELDARLTEELERLRGETDSPLLRGLEPPRGVRLRGFNDGTIYPPESFEAGTPEAVTRAGAAQRAPLRGAVRVIVVLADFSDAEMTETADHFRDLFFSNGVLPNGSVKEYYAEVTHGLVDIVGDVIGPLRLPQTLAWYANNNFGIGRPTGTPRAHIMAQDAAIAADPLVDFGPYDNDGDGFVDAFIVVHAGPGGEVTGNPGHVWSHKWVLPSVYTADSSKIFAYLTIPEDAKIGVSAHELGHLLFGFPDLYDIDDTSSGVGNWCLMGGGSWNGGGEIPAHPSAWCKIDQGWASVTNVTSAGMISFPDVKSSHTVHRLWKDGASGPEYFLVENRQRAGYDAELPGDGLLIWHVDEGQPDNSDETHYKVGLVQADGDEDLEHKSGRGDSGDPYPGSDGNTAFSGTTTPSSDSHDGQETCIAATEISASGATMTARVSVSCGKAVIKDRKDLKDRFEGKDLRKDLKDRFEGKDFRKELKDRFEGKDLRKEAKDAVEGWAPPAAGADPLAAAVSDLEGRVAALEEALGTGASEPFIGADLRPDLMGGPQYDDTASQLQQQMGTGDRDAKREFDTPAG